MAERDHCGVSLKLQHRPLVLCVYEDINPLTTNDLQVFPILMTQE